MSARGRGPDTELVAFCHSEHRRLVGLLALYVGDEPTAQELAQDAFAKLCEHWGRVQAMDNRRAWLNRVALNLARSWLRRRYAERRARARHGPDTDVEEHRAAEVVAVRSAVAALPTRQRTALVLRYYADLPVAEVAAQMRCAEGTVKALTHRAIATLRERSGLAEAEEVHP